MTNWRQILSWQTEALVAHWKDYDPRRSDSLYSCDVLDQMPASELRKVLFTIDPRRITCPTCLEERKFEKMADILLEKHHDECARKRAEFTNIGWGSSDTGIASKTDRGILESKIDPVTLRVTHVWSED